MVILLILTRFSNTNFEFVDSYFNYNLSCLNFTLDKNNIGITLIRQAIIIPLAFILSFRYRKFFKFEGNSS